MLIMILIDLPIIHILIIIDLLFLWPSPASLLRIHTLFHRDEAIATALLCLPISNHNGLKIDKNIY